MIVVIAHHELASLGAYALGMSGASALLLRAVVGERGRRLRARWRRRPHAADPDDQAVVALTGEPRC